MPVTLHWEDEDRSILRWAFTDLPARSVHRHDPRHTRLQPDDRRLTRFPEAVTMMDAHPKGASPIVIIGATGVR